MIWQAILMLIAVVLVAHSINALGWWLIPVLPGELTSSSRLVEYIEPWGDGYHMVRNLEATPQDDGVYLVTGFSDSSRDGLYRLPARVRS